MDVEETQALELLLREQLQQCFCLSSISQPMCLEATLTVALSKISREQRPTRYWQWLSLCSPGKLQKMKLKHTILNFQITRYFSQDLFCCELLDADGRNTSQLEIKQILQLEESLALPNWRHILSRTWTGDFSILCFSPCCQ